MWGCMYLCFASIDQTIPCYLKATRPAIAISYCDPKPTVTCPPKPWGQEQAETLLFFAEEFGAVGVTDALLLVSFRNAA